MFKFCYNMNQKMLSFVKEVANNIGDAASIFIKILVLCFIGVFYSTMNPESIMYKINLLFLTYNFLSIIVTTIDVYESKNIDKEKNKDIPVIVFLIFVQEFIKHLYNLIPIYRYLVVFSSFYKEKESII